MEPQRKRARLDENILSASASVTFDSNEIIIGVTTQSEENNEIQPANNEIIPTGNFFKYAYLKYNLSF